MTNAPYSRLWDDALRAVQRALDEGGDLPAIPVPPEADTEARAREFLTRYVMRLRQETGVVPAALAAARFAEAGPILHRILGAYEQPENTRRLAEGVDATLDACVAFLLGVWGPPISRHQLEGTLAGAVAMRTGWLLGLWSGAADAPPAADAG